MKKNITPSSIFKPTVVTLDSGIRLAIDSVPFVGSCALGVWIDAGTRDEPRGRTGVAHLVEHTSFRRTKSLSTQGIARAFEDVGAYINAYTTKEDTSFEVRVLTEHLPKVVSTLSEVILRPQFDADDVAKERSIVTEEIRSYEDDPEERVFDSGEQMLFGKHPLGNPILGTVESVAKLDHNDVQAFHDKWYTGRNMHICISGNVNVDEVVELFSRTFDVAKGKSTPKRMAPVIDSVRRHTEQRAIQQSHILLQVPVSGSIADDRHALAILNVILGDGMTSRLNRKVRELKGMAYNIYSQLQQFRDIGIMAIYAGVDPANVEQARKVILNECRNIASDTITKVELKRAMMQIRASRIMALESLNSRISSMAKGMLEFGMPEDPYAELEELERTSLDEVHALASKVCNVDGWSEYLLIPEN